MSFNRRIYALAIIACVGLIGASAAAQGGELVRAEWGAPGHTVDVTARVRTFIHDGTLQLEVTRKCDVRVWNGSLTALQRELEICLKR